MMSDNDRGGASYSRPPRFWNMLGAAEQEALREIGASVVHGKGERLLREGEVSDRVVVMRTGWVKISNQVRDGQAALALRGPGDLVGEAALDNEPCTATVTALSEVSALSVAADELVAYLERVPGARRALRLAERGRRVESDRARRMNVNSDQRLARLFLDLVEDDVGRVDAGPDGVTQLVLDVPLSQGEIGQLISASRVTVERILRDWRRRGFVTTSYRGIALLRLDALRRIAGADR